MNQVNFRGDIGQIQRFLYGRVAAADDRDLLVTIKESIASCAGGNAFAFKCFFRRQPQITCGGTRGDDQGVAGVLIAVAEQAERTGLQVDAVDVVEDDFRIELGGMETQPPMLEKLPYIVVMVDEFADLMMAVGKKVEELIARLAQKARAAGIHLVLATQRPSVDVITGLIKANIPTRIAFTVSSKIDSRTILDQGGAESLLGMGDMLYMAPNSSIPVRVHGAFVRDQEVHAVVQDWKARGRPEYIDSIVKGGDEGEGGSLGLDGDEELDPLFDQAVAFVVEKRRASISGVQRQFRIGYNRAARLVEQMEAQGIVSSPGHNGNREVLAPPPME